MKKPILFTFFALICFTAIAQSVKIRLKIGGFYYTDSLGKVKDCPNNPDDKFKIEADKMSNGYYVSSYKNDDVVVYIDPSQIYRSASYQVFLTNLPGNGYSFKKDNNSYYYSDIITDSTLKKSLAYENIKQYLQSLTVPNVAGGINVDDKESGRLIGTYVYTLFYKQGFGKREFTLRYRVTVDVKDGKYRYYIDDIILGYTTVMYNISEIKTLKEEVLKGNDTFDQVKKRLDTTDETINTFISGLKQSAKRKLIADF